MKKVAVQTLQRETFIDITERVNRLLRARQQEAGACVVFCPHTTAGITINECSDPDVVLDMKQALGNMVAEDAHWRHVEGNSSAHVKASLMGSSAIVPVVQGELQMGRWQGIFLCEFDGPRTREIWVHVLS